MDENKIIIIATAPKKAADKAAWRRKSFISMVQKCNNYFPDEHSTCGQSHGCQIERNKC